MVNKFSQIKVFLTAHNVRAWRLFTIAPIGRAEWNDDLRLSAEQLKYLLDFIANSRSGNNILVTFGCESWVGEYEKKIRDAAFFCRAGINIASVLIDGSISACPNINRSFVQGNIYRDSFLDVWNNMIVKSFQQDKYNFFTAPYPPFPLRYSRGDRPVFFLKIKLK